jgi:hypothetical protein
MDLYSVLRLVYIAFVVGLVLFVAWNVLQLHV